MCVGAEACNRATRRREQCGSSLGLVSKRINWWEKEHTDQVGNEEEDVLVGIVFGCAGRHSCTVGAAICAVAYCGHCARKVVYIVAKGARVSRSGPLFSVYWSTPLLALWGRKLVFVLCRSCTLADNKLRMRSG
jgi:hypothetical protein